MQKPTILVVDDELFFRRLYADTLGESEYAVETWASGEEALERVGKGGVDLLLTDLVMPGMSGLDLLRQVRMVNNPPEVILVTGHATLETAIQALKNGARDYLIKPFQPDELRHLVHTCLEQRRLLDENTLLKSQIRLFQRGQQLASLLEVDRLLSQSVATLLQEAGGGRAFAFLVGQHRQLSRISAAEGLAENEAEGLANALLPRLLDVDEFLVRSGELPEGTPMPPDLHTLWVCPLFSQKRLRGGIVLTNPSGSGNFSFPLESLRFLGEQAALGFQNAYLYQGARELIYTDDLTGLHNYRYLQLILNREIRRTERYGLSFALIFIDLDYFKNVNDTHGHLAGSAALREVATVLRKSVREVDLLFRYGGDEFTALLVETDGRGGAVVAERIRRTIENHLFLTEEGLNLRLTTTVGFAAFPEDARTKEDIVDLADRAMYHGKKTRNAARGPKDLDGRMS